VIRWAQVAVWTGWATLILFILSSAAGESPIEPAPSTRVIQLSLAPEGWAFFTRSPREPADVVYSEAGGRLTRLSFPNTSGRNLFGLSRSARAFDAELTALLAPVLTSTWRDCEGDPAGCASRLAPRPLELVNWSTTRYICGDVVVVRSAPVPWAWRRSRDRVHMDSKVLRLRVDCGQKRSVVYR
jgi:sporulation delaying protein A